jgi:hypothetical protein
MRFLVLSCSVAAVALALGVARPVRACSCNISPLYGVIAPSEGSTVPRNARIWLGYFDGEVDEVELRNLNQDVVIDLEPSEIAIREGVVITVLSPRELLEPGEYAFETPRFSQVLFEVVDEIDTTPPELPLLERVESSVSDDDGDSCGTYRGAQLWLEAEGIVLALGAEHDEPDNDPPAGRVASATVASEDEARFGFATACGDGPWPGGERVELRFGSFDLAGNFSGLSDPETVERPEDTSCSVALGRPRHKGALAVLTLLALTLVGRGRRSRA